MAKDTSLPRLPVRGVNMYDKIAEVHKRMVEIKWRAGRAKGQIVVGPDLVLHVEEAVTFLAGELLKLKAASDGQDES